MEMKKIGDKIVMERTLPGVAVVTFEHEIKDTKARLHYDGPMIPPEVWYQILGFFKWCNDTYHSECQVRLFVNPKEGGGWRAWAYPQEAKTGMNAREINRAETVEEGAARFASWGVPPSGDWMAFGTVHSHCGMQAFQSGTDEVDEKRQDGLHITIGKLNDKKFDLDARFYSDQMKWNNSTLRMDWFWDIGDQNLEMLPENCWDSVARHQMCTLPANVEVPKQWIENVIEIKPISVTYPHSSTGKHIHHVTPTHGGPTYGGGSNGTNVDPPPGQLEPVWKRAQTALTYVFDEMERLNVDPQEVEEFLNEADTAAGELVCKACRHHRVDPSDMLREYESMIEAVFRKQGIKEQQEQADNDLAKALDEDAWRHLGS